MTTRRVRRQCDVPTKLGISDSMFALWLSPKSKYFQSDFPQKIDYGFSRKVFWEDELDAWIDSRKVDPTSPKSRKGKKNA